VDKVDEEGQESRWAMIRPPGPITPESETDIAPIFGFWGFDAEETKALLDRMKVTGVTVHGFRSSFRDWASERTSFPHEVCEAALAHVIENKAEAAYRRGDRLDRIT
jgi:integrase